MTRLTNSLAHANPIAGPHRLERHTMTSRPASEDTASATKSLHGPRPQLSVVVPCYNEDAVLDELHRRLTASCRSVELTYEIVLVNDGSDDGTWSHLLALADDDSHLVLVNLARNHGHQLALTAGLNFCRGESILILDADLQDPPELLSDMLERLRNGADVVYGRRRRRTRESLFKRTTAALFYRLIDRLADVTIHRDTGDFRLMTRRVLDVLLTMRERRRFLRGMVSWVGLRQEMIEYDRDARFAGTSKYPLGAMIRFALDAITSFSVRPLKISYLLAFTIGFLAVPTSIGAGIAWWSGAPSFGGLVIAASVMIVGSLQLATLGIFGEYLGRIYEQVLDRPLFLVDRVVRADSTLRASETNDNQTAFALNAQ
jgi:polyisoprenyl-phosphate glycosyltransferase